MGFGLAIGFLGHVILAGSLLWGTQEGMHTT
jgi:hypothetical protein